MTKGYEINEKDIESVLNFLKQTDPENATSEMAIEILEHLQKTFHSLSHTNPDQLTKIYNELKKTKKTKN
jgi:hypothetical protein